MTSKTRFILAVALFLISCAQAFAVSIPASPGERQNAQNMAYGNLLRVKKISLTTTTKAVTWDDITATNTYSTSMDASTMGGGLNYSFPIQVEIIPATTTDTLYMLPYAVASSAGLTVPTATTGGLMYWNYPTVGSSQIGWERRFVGKPNMVICSPSAAATFTIRIWSAQP